jgi:hypothetical protein
VIFRRPAWATGIFACDVIIVAVDITAATHILIDIIIISNLIYITAVIVFIIIIIIIRVHTINEILLVCDLHFLFVKNSNL